MKLPPFWFCFVLLADALLLPAQTVQQSPQDLLKEAVAFQQQGKLAEAVRAYDQFLDLYPDSPEVRSNLGAALVAEGKYTRAIDEYKLALLKKDDPRLHLNLALAYYKTDEFPAAMAELEKLQAADKTNLQVTLLLADCELRAGQNKKTINLLLPFYTGTTDDRGVLYLLGTALARDGQVEQAQRVINPLMQGPDSPEKHMLLGTAKFTARDFPGALKELKVAEEMNPELPEVNSYYGQALFSNGETAESLAVFQKELAHNPNDFQANVHIGLILRQSQKDAEAMPYFKRALAAHPGDVAIRYQIALVKMAEGKDAAACGDLEQIVAESPKFLEAHVSLSTVYYREKRKEDGNRERVIVQKLNEEKQARQPAVKAEQGNQ
jgi:tetratricopeptide (TPR) repeat protein